MISILSTGVFGIAGNDTSSRPTISANGQFVAFYSDASSLVSGDTNTVRDVFVRDRDTGITSRISVSTAGVEGDDMVKIVVSEPPVKFEQNLIFGSSINFTAKYMCLLLNRCNHNIFSLADFCFWVK